MPPIYKSKEPKDDDSFISETPKKNIPKKETFEKEFKIKKKIKKEPILKPNSIPSKNLRQDLKEKELNSKTTVPINLPRFNTNKLFYDILSLSNKDEDFLMMISNILTTGSRQLVRKLIQLF